MGIKTTIIAIGMRPTTYIQPGGTGPWYDHNGDPAIPVAGGYGVCIFTWVNSPPGASTPQQWKVTNKCTAGHSCSPPL